MTLPSSYHRDTYERDVTIGGAHFAAWCGERTTMHGQQFAVWTLSPWHNPSQGGTLCHSIAAARALVDRYIDVTAPAVAAVRAA